MNARDELLPAARELLDEFGTSATVTRSGIADAPLAAQKFGKASRTKEAVETINTIAVIVDPETAGNNEGQRTAQSVAIMLVQPVSGDTLTIGDSIYRIGKVTKIAPQGQAIYFEAEVS
ncbi:hypothetical protein C8J42_102525 [Sphingomonas sp. PP-CE-1A-559]|uniref:hypothetical protein n=1 Tax=Sphingomonas sp. PP-CE-1A-559 TaxID=2135657 RepID=UPI001056232E|nr:hypothetical protein [Sphingomonas sp. PP-CE-1A-559]TCP92749.1 hypothetical protein C8J42_102525 [Sphingomonas sp. PP-CE-1A-559]